MKTKEATLYPELKETDMTDIDRKIHNLLIAEGYRATSAGRFEWIEINNFTNVDRMEFMRGEQRVIVSATHRMKETA